MSGYLLDTHTWLWLQQGAVEGFPSELVAELEQQQAQQRVCVSAISVLEIARLVVSGQYDLGISVDQFVAEATKESGLRILELTTRILIESTRLPGDIHRDPSDRLIAATAREYGLTLVTSDKLLLQYAKHGHLNARKV